MDQIREARIEDLETIVKYNFNLAKETEHKELNLEILTKGVKGLLSNDQRGKFYVYTIDDKVVGQLMHTYEWSDWRNGNFLWIQSVYIDQEYRRRGIFKALYNHVKKIADNDDAVVGLRLYVERENKNAMNTYTKLGMVECDYNIYEYEK